MRLIDLTHTLRSNIPVYPGDGPVKLEQVREIESDGFSNFSLTSEMHVGTHIDGPLHLIAGSDKIAVIPLERFTGCGVLIDVRGITEIGLKEIAHKLIPCESIVLFYSGLDRKFDDPDYHLTYPVLSEELALFLVERKVRMIGIDWISPDRSPYPIHKFLLGNNMLILENLTNLDQLLNETEFEIFAFPLRIEADSSMVRAVARIGQGPV